jgi:hypothetical protein
MIQWLAFAVCFYTLALLVFGSQPQLQTLCWKLGNVTVAAFVGYKVDIHAFKSVVKWSTGSDLWQIRRAIVMAAAMLAVSIGL